MDRQITTRDNAFSDLLLHWYHNNKREMPWRLSNDPYKIWISEIMLQQTQVDTVIPYFERFMKAFPTVFLLAEAHEDEVFKLWEGLGYYSRARNIMRAARDIVEQHAGELPSDYRELIKLAGIGPYTSGAILSIAFHKKFAAVDGNVMRVYGRLKILDVDIADPKNRHLFEALVLEDMPEADTSGFTQGLMELGATVCTPKNPKCTLCPVKDMCRAYEKDLVTLYPVKSKKAKQTIHEIAVLYCTYENQVLLIKKNEPGLLSGLWGFPLIEGINKATIESEILDYLDEIFGVSAVTILSRKQAEHVFTHRIWKMTRFDVVLKHRIDVDYPEMKWVTVSEIEDFALSTALRKIL